MQSIFGGGYILDIIFFFKNGFFTTRISTYAIVTDTLYFFMDTYHTSVLNVYGSSLTISGLI